VVRKTYLATEHDIDTHLIDPDALYVIEKLKAAGFEAYLVGGSVRDLLAKKVPKDFDISTSARPEQIKRIFQRNCLLIGRRFRLAHVRFGPKIFEVSTFRAGESSDDLITADNQWGTPEEDALRRDFTINGLFYDPEQHEVIDYVGGWDDTHRGILRTIGDPVVRFRQDPVRMIRLLKFQARFNFSVDERCQKALVSCRDEIEKSSPARVLEEILRMLESGASSAFFRLMGESGLLELLFPCITHFIQGQHGHRVFRYLEEADSINSVDIKKPLNRDVLAACLLFPILEQELQAQFTNKGLVPHISDIILVTGSIIQGFVISSFSHFPKRMSAAMGFILSTQFRFTPFSGKRHSNPRLVRNKEFPVALQFLMIRARVEPELSELYESLKQHHQRTPRQNHPHHHADTKQMPAQQTG